MTRTAKQITADISNHRQQLQQLYQAQIEINEEIRLIQDCVRDLCFELDKITPGFDERVAQHLNQEDEITVEPA